MANHNISPVREQLRAEILAALASAPMPMTTSSLYQSCPSATHSEEVARVAYELKRKGLIADGGKVIHPLGMPVNSYVLGDASAISRMEAAKPIQAEQQIKPTRQPAIKRKPAPGHPFQAPIRQQEAHDSLPRITRDLPSHLTTQAPPASFMADPMSYVPDPEAAARRLPTHLQTQKNIMPEAPADTLEPSAMAALKGVDSDLAMEALEGVDADLAQALFAMSQMDDVGEIAKKSCQCAKIPAPPKMPSSFRYASFSTEIESDRDDGILSFETNDVNGDIRISLNTHGEVTFDLDEIAMIPEVASFLNSLHISE